jgi:hypothetical protein
MKIWNLLKLVLAAYSHSEHHNESRLYIKRHSLCHTKQILSPIQDILVTAVRQIAGVYCDYCRKHTSIPCGIIQSF